MAAVLTIKQGRREVVLGKASTRVRDGAEPVVRLKPTAAGRRMLRDRRKQSATLVVTHSRPGGGSEVVRTQKMRV